MGSIEDLETKKKQLQLQRDISRMELERASFSFVQKWKWGLLLLGVVLTFLVSTCTLGE